MARRNATAEELEAQAKSNGYKRGAHREKDSTLDNGKHNKKTKRSQNSVLDRYVSWTLLGMQEDALQRDLPAPDEAYARHHCLHQGVEAPDLATIKDFFRFFIATSCGKIVTKPTVDSLNTNNRLEHQSL